MECEAAHLPVTGELPRGLRGTLYRNGPNPQFMPADPATHHWFLGDGMVHGFTLGDGRASYRNRWVRTPKFCAEAAAGKPGPGGWSMHEGGVANTNIVRHAGQLLALEEGHLPIALDPRSLGTIGPQDFGGALGGPFTAHPKTDPRMAGGPPFAWEPELGGYVGVIRRDQGIASLRWFRSSADRSGRSASAGLRHAPGRWRRQGSARGSVAGPCGEWSGLASKVDSCEWTKVAEGAIGRFTRLTSQGNSRSGGGMRYHEIIGEEGPAQRVGIDGLFEMANLRQNRTGVPGTIYISTAQASHGPRVKHYAERPSEGAPYFAVSISANPEVVDVKGLAEHEVNTVSSQVIEWVRLNHEKLLRFWTEGTSWYDEEVDAFKRSLTKLPRGWSRPR